MKAKSKNTGNNIKASTSHWTFSGKVANNFDSHIDKSVPLYQWIHDLTVKYSDYFIQKNSRVYDIGCSTGTLLKKIAVRNTKKKIKLTGIDCEKNMIKVAKKNLKKNNNVNFLLGDFLDIKLEPSNLFISLFTIQFIHPSKRQDVFNKIYSNLEWGGGFIFFEKIRGPDARFQDMLTTIYTEYKLDKGFDESEIVSKSLSLKGILEPFTSNENVNFLKRSGFKDQMLIFKYLCFEGYLAIK